jgi:hypothetical protein
LSGTLRHAEELADVRRLHEVGVEVLHVLLRAISFLSISARITASGWNTSSNDETIDNATDEFNANAGEILGL